MSKPPVLSPEMLLFEVAAICSRHGIPVSTSNPGAAVEHATRLLQTLGVMPHEPIELLAAPADATAELERAAIISPTTLAPIVPLPRGNDDPPRRRHALDNPDAFRFERGTHRPGAERVLRLAPEGGA